MIDPLIFKPSKKRGLFILKNLRSSHRELDRRRQSGGVRLSIRRLPEMIANTIPQSVSLRLADSPLCTRGPTITTQLLKPPLCKRRWHGVSRDGGIVSLNCRFTDYRN